MMRAAIAAVALVLAAATPVRAGSPELLATIKLSLPERVAGQGKLADAAKARGDRDGEAAHAIEACIAYLFMTFDATGAPCVRAEETSRALPTTFLLARLRGYQSIAVAWTLDWTKARALTDEAERLGAGGPAETTLAGDALRVIHLVRGSIDGEQGKFGDAAKAELDRFLASSRAAGDLNGVAGGESFLCRTYWRTGQYPEAFASCERGLVAARQVDDPFTITGLLWNRGAAYADRGELAAAAASWTEALAFAERGVIPFLEVTVRSELAGTLIELGRLDEAARHIDSTVATIAAGRAPRFFALTATWLAGELATARGDLRAAIAAFRESAASPLESIVMHSLVGEASAHHALGELAEAERLYRAAIARIETARATGSDVQKTGFMQRQVRSYRELVAVLWDQRGVSAAADALTIAEALRARSLLDALRSAGVEGHLAKPLDAKALQASVPDGTTLVVYVASEHRLFGFAITRAAIAMAVLPGAGTRDQLASRIDLYRSLLATADTPEDLAAPGSALYADLLAPLVGDAPPAALVIAADGPLHLLPFDALYRPGAGFVIEHSTVAMTPSGSFLVGTSDRTTTSPILAVTSPPITTMPVLPASRLEGEMITATIAGEPRVLAGEAATEARFRASTPASYAVLHFATHAVIDDIAPLRSGLLLAPGGGGNDDDGWLRADEIYRMQLAARLVVLSSCSTGSGHVSPEGPMSLARAFLQSGVRSVIATLWDVEDRRGPALARALYGELVGGAPVGVALARAKRSLIARGSPPRAWAAWVAIGHDDALPGLVARATPGSHSFVLTIVLGALGVLAIAGSFVLARTRA